MNYEQLKLLFKDAKLAIRPELNGWVVEVIGGNQAIPGVPNNTFVFTDDCKLADFVKCYGQVTSGKFYQSGG